MRPVENDEDEDEELEAESEDFTPFDLPSYPQTSKLGISMDEANACQAFILRTSEVSTRSSLSFHLILKREPSEVSACTEDSHDESPTSPTFSNNSNTFNDIRLLTPPTRDTFVELLTK